VSAPLRMRTNSRRLDLSAVCRLCCKSLFAVVIKNSPGFRRDLRVKMWGTSSATDKLTGDLGNMIEAAQIGVRRSDRITARKSSPDAILKSMSRSNGMTSVLARPAFPLPPGADIVSRQRVAGQAGRCCSYRYASVRPGTHPTTPSREAMLCITAKSTADRE
jgi:hypothetical protein